MKKVICITGMHRSGTSLTASWLQKCGVNIAMGNNLLGSSVGNSKGHFEDLDFVKLHSKILKTYNPKSNGWKVFSSRNGNFEDSHKIEVKEIIKSRNNEFELWGWKDPRTSLFLNNWKKNIPHLKYLFIWREAHQVVSSLRKRYSRSQNKIDKIYFREAYKNWKIYNQEILEFYHKYPEDCLIVSINDLISNDEAFLQIINDQFNFKLNYYPIDKLVEPNLLSNKEESWSHKALKGIYGIEEIEKELRHSSLTLS